MQEKHSFPHFVLHALIYCYFTILQIKFERRQYALLFEGVRPLLELRILEMHCFPIFSPTCFDVLR